MPQTWVGDLSGCQLQVMPQTWVGDLSGCQLLVMPRTEWVGDLSGCQLQVMPWISPGWPQNWKGFIICRFSLYFLPIHFLDFNNLSLTVTNDKQSSGVTSWKAFSTCLVNKSLNLKTHFSSLILAPTIVS
ncbi:hypothetical protein BsWGS_00943 [Bradybaena similaris]